MGEKSPGNARAGSEEVRFELTKRFRVYTLSKRAPSATRTLLLKGFKETHDFTLKPLIPQRKLLLQELIRKVKCSDF